MTSNILTIGRRTIGLTILALMWLLIAAIALAGLALLILCWTGAYAVVSDLPTLIPNKPMVTVLAIISIRGFIAAALVGLGIVIAKYAYSLVEEVYEDWVG